MISRTFNVFFSWRFETCGSMMQFLFFPFYLVPSVSWQTSNEWHDWCRKACTDIQKFEHRYHGHHHQHSHNSYYCLAAISCTCAVLLKFEYFGILGWWRKEGWRNWWLTTALLFMLTTTTSVFVWNADQFWSLVYISNENYPFNFDRFIKQNFANIVNVFTALQLLIFVPHPSAKVRDGRH